MIQFNFEHITPIILPTNVEAWLEDVVLNEKRKLGVIHFIFCDDQYLLKINQQYLSHDYFTDIITFDYTKGKTISGDIFVSLQRVKDNAKVYLTDEDTELKRVLVHGILHLCGYKDHSEEEILLMRTKENFYLNLF